MVPGVGRDELDVSRGGRGQAQIATAQLLAREQRVDMGVDEPGQQGPAIQVDRLGRIGAGSGAWRPGRLHRGDPAAPDPHAGAGGQEAAAVEHSAVAEDDLVAGQALITSLGEGTFRRKSSICPSRCQCL